MHVLIENGLCVCVCVCVQTVHQYLRDISALMQKEQQLTALMEAGM
jgi:hypothetical protein